jgi:hypothetical protein
VRVPGEEGRARAAHGGAGGGGCRREGCARGAGAPWRRQGADPRRGRAHAAAAVVRRVLKLQDAVDALEHSPVAEEAEAEAAGTTSTVENAVAAADLLGSGENNGEMEDKSAAETATEVEVDSDRAVADGVESANLGADESADEDAEGHCH